MSYLSPLLTMLVNAVKKSTSNLDRDFSEIERLQSSVRPYQNFVTNSYNKTAQNLRIELAKIRPDALFIENSVKTIPAKGSCFLVNPIDGLNNFSRGIALFATTVAYCENGEVKASVIYNRASDELYFAEKGNGSYKEGFRSHERLRVSTNKDETFALISAQVGYDATSEDFAKSYNRISKVASQSRMLGAVSVAMYYTAAGKTDITASFGNNLNSVVAGLLLVKEAGGYVYNLDGKEIAPAKLEEVIVGDNIVASNNNMEALIKKIA